MLSDTTIRLRALEPEDLDFLYRWENDTTLWEFGSTLTPYSKYVLHEYLQSAHLDIYQMRQLRLMIELKSAQECAGTIDLYDFDPIHSRAAVGILIDKAFQHQGLGKKSLLLLMQYAFEFLHIHQLYAYIPAGNKASLRLFENCGFEICGKLKDWNKKNNGYTDVWVLQHINSTFVR